MKVLSALFLLVSVSCYGEVRAELSSLLAQLESINTMNLCEPTRFEAGGVGEVTAAFGRLNPNSLEDLKNNSEDIFVRYLYSPRWGWIDLKHFTMGAYQTDRPLMTGRLVLALGELLELAQMLGEKNSSWSYEDLTSNLLGVYFPTYIKETEFPPKATVVDKLERYLKDLGFVEEPLEIAPNASQMRKISLSGREYEITPPAVRNFTYTPEFTLPESEYPRTELDRKIKRFLFGLPR